MTNCRRCIFFQKFTFARVICSKITDTRHVSDKGIGNCSHYKKIPLPLRPMKKDKKSCYRCVHNKHFVYSYMCTKEESLFFDQIFVKGEAGTRARACFYFNRGHNNDLIDTGEDDE